MLVAHGVDGSSSNAPQLARILSGCVNPASPSLKAMILLFNLFL
jgi:hypothetical protein